MACYTVRVRNRCKILVEKPGKSRRVWEKVSTIVISGLFIYFPNGRYIDYLSLI